MQQFSYLKKKKKKKKKKRMVHWDSKSEAVT